MLRSSSSHLDRTDQTAAKSISRPGQGPAGRREDPAGEQVRAAPTAPQRVQADATGRSGAPAPVKAHQPQQQSG
jgi:hypothetical protein